MVLIQPVVVHGVLGQLGQLRLLGFLRFLGADDILGVVLGVLADIAFLLLDKVAV